MRPNTPFLLAGCRVEPARYHLSSAAGETSLPPKVMAVLQELAAAHPEVISREQLIAAVWQGNRYVGEKAVTNAIWQLRQSLGEHGAGENCIETIRKSGYRLQIAPQLLTEPQAATEAGLGPEPDTDSPAPTAQRPAELVPQRPGRPAKLIVTGVILTCLLVLGAVWFGWPAANPPQLSSPVDVTNAPGAERYPSPSPDGRWLAYVASAPGGPSDLYLLDLQNPGTPARRLSEDDAEEGRPLWSPDAAHLYFLANASGRGCKVWRLRLRDGERSALAACEGAASRHPSLSPDGRTLAFLGPDQPPAGRRIQLLDLEDGAVSVLPCEAPCEAPERDRDAAFSPDGRWLALSRRGGADIERLYLLDRQSGEQHRLTDYAQDIRGLAWQPDSRALLLASLRPGGPELRRFVMGRFGVSGENSQLLSGEDLSHPAFSADGLSLFVEQAAQRSGLTVFDVADPERGGARALLHGLHRYEQAAWSPVAQQLAYVSNVSGAAELWLARADGSGRRQLTRFGSAISQPVWSADGRQLAFLAVTEGSVGNRVYRITLPDVSSDVLPLPQALPTPFAYHAALAFGCDGHCLWLAAGDVRRAGLYRLPLQGGEAGDMKEPERMSDANVREIQTLANGELYYRHASRRGIYHLTGADSRKDERLPGSQSMDSDFGWHIEDQTLYFFRTEQTLQFIAQSLSAPDAPPRTLLRIPHGHLALKETPQHLGDQQWLLTERIVVSPDIRRFQYEP